VLVLVIVRVIVNEVLQLSSIRLRLLIYTILSLLSTLPNRRKLYTRYQCCYASIQPNSYVKPGHAISQVIYPPANPAANNQTRYGLKLNPFHHFDQFSAVAERSTAIDTCRQGITFPRNGFTGSAEIPGLDPSAISLDARNAHNFN
jgi:hypothetical protein